MNLPFIFDVVLGLIFIYLILSLLASEIQELLATVFQWRAQHLRRSIENFIAGDIASSDDAKVVQLVNSIYSNPLVKTMNQQARGALANIPRRFTWSVASAFRGLSQPTAKLANTTTTETSGDGTQLQNDTVFGDGRHSGPSYIPGDVFASSLVNTLNLPQFAQKLSTSRLETFKTEALEAIQAILFQLQEQTAVNEDLQAFLDVAYQGFAELQADFERITWSYQQGEVELDAGLNQMRTSFDKFIQLFETEKPGDNYSYKALQNLKNLRQQLLADVEQTIVAKGLQPSLQQVAGIVNKDSSIYQEVAKTLGEEDTQLTQTLEYLTEKLPDGLANNIMAIAQTTETKVRDTRQQLQALTMGIESSFNNSMERASGVYKRNAKGMTLLIGLMIAGSTNADAFHMVNRLSKDSVLRATISENAGQIVLQNRNNLNYVDINTLRTQTDAALDDIALPIGWNDANLERQINWTTKKQQIFPFCKLITIIPGWIVSGIAIGMGAPFWFDLLGKVANVRNVGRPPASDSQSGR